MSSLQTVLHYWFETPNDYEKWFFSGQKLDSYIRKTFSNLLIQAKNNKLKTSNTREKLGLIILLDQFSRHIYRSTPDAFSSDAQSLEVAKELVTSGEIHKLTSTEQLFAIMPYQHSESVQDKDDLLSFAKTKLKNCDDTDQNTYKQLIHHTNGHKEVLEKFGRYPKRNIALGRKSTEKELIYLEQNPNEAY